MLWKIQQDMKEWLDHNFPDTTPLEQFLGIVEEVGELSHVILKDQQGIREAADPDYNPVPEIQDAIGDIAIYLINFCNKMGWDFSSVLARTWDTVHDRDWQKNPELGKQVVFEFDKADEDE